MASSLFSLPTSSPRMQQTTDCPTLLFQFRVLSSQLFLSPVHPHSLCKTTPSLFSFSLTILPSVLQLCKPKPSSPSYCLCLISTHIPMPLPHEPLSSLCLPHSFSLGFLRLGRLKILSQLALAGTILYILASTCRDDPVHFRMLSSFPFLLSQGPVRSTP